MAELDSFRTARWVRTLHLVLQGVLLFTFLAGLNYLVRDHPLRFDLTQHRSYSLSPETLSYLHLERPVRIVATFTDTTENPEIRGLLREYATATEGNYDPRRGLDGRITVECLDVYQNRRRAEDLGIAQPNALVLICGDRRRALLVDELYHLNAKKERDSFQGEQVLTSALLDVSNPVRQKIYFLSGHGELSPEQVDAKTGLSDVRDQLKARNFEVGVVDLTVTRKIPADASLIVDVWPQTRFSAAEQELLRQHLGANAGRLILFLAPGISAISLGLDDLLLDWGVLVDDDVICDTGAENLTEDNDLLVHSFRQGHPIIQSLWDMGLALRFGFARSVRPDPGLTSGSGLTVVTLAATSKTAWGETGYRLGRPPRFNNAGNIHPLPGMDPPDSLGLVVASERVGVRDKLPFSVRGGRLVVFGTGDLIANTRLGVAGNWNIFLGAVNWTVEGREGQLNIPARPIERFQLSLSAGSLLNLRYTLLLALPAGAALLGLLVYWTRRT
jgi:hypothetical protein